MSILRQSTAIDVLIGPFVDVADAASAEVGETPTVKLSKAGQALAAKNDVTVPVHDADGYYNCELDATDTDTVGTLVLIVAATATALPVRHEFQVIEESAYDRIYAASAVGPLTAAEVNTECDTAITDAALATAANLATVDTVVDTLTTNLATVDTVVDTLTTDLATVDTVVDAVKVATDKLVFTVANQVDVNVQSINDVTITGDGGATPFNV